MTNDTWYHRAQELEAECATLRSDRRASAEAFDKVAAELAAERDRGDNWKSACMECNDKRDAALSVLKRVRPWLQTLTGLHGLGKHPELNDALAQIDKVLGGGDE